MDRLEAAIRATLKLGEQTKTRVDMKELINFLRFMNESFNEHELRAKVWSLIDRGDLIMTDDWELKLVGGT